MSGHPIDGTEALSAVLEILVNRINEANVNTGEFDNLCDPNLHGIDINDTLDAYDITLLKPTSNFTISYSPLRHELYVYNTVEDTQVFTVHSDALPGTIRYRNHLTTAQWKQWLRDTFGDYLKEHGLY